MRYEYEIHGPFKISKANNGLIDRHKSARSGFWETVREKEASLPSACGCYLFAIRAGKGIKPWYVGKAAEQSFEGECLNRKKLGIYNYAVANRKGAPLSFLIAKKTPTGRFTKPGPAQKKNIDFLETALIGAALDRNPKLMNIQKTKPLKDMCVPGLINSPQGKPKGPVKQFKKAIR
jgi:hypothetical protein